MIWLSESGASWTPGSVLQAWPQLKPRPTSANPKRTSGGSAFGQPRLDVSHWSQGFFGWYGTPRTYGIELTLRR